MSDSRRDAIDNFVNEYHSRYQNNKHKIKTRIRGNFLIFLCEKCNAQSKFSISRFEREPYGQKYGFVEMACPTKNSEFGVLCKRFDILK